MVQEDEYKEIPLFTINRVHLFFIYIYKPLFS